MSHTMHLVQSLILLLSISIISKSQTTESPCTPPQFCTCQPILAEVCCSGTTYDNQCSADCECQFNCEQGACTSDPTELPTQIPTSDPTGFPTENIFDITTTIQTECFIGFECKSSDDCCPDDIDEYSIGVKCMKKKKSRSSSSRKSHSKKKKKNFCCIKKGFSGCVEDKDCCPGKHGKKSMCSDESICVSKKNGHGKRQYNGKRSKYSHYALVNEEEIDDTASISLGTHNESNSNTKWIIFGVLFGFIVVICALCYVCMRNVSFNKYFNVPSQVSNDENTNEQIEEGCDNGPCNIMEYGVIDTQE